MQSNDNPPESTKPPQVGEEPTPTTTVKPLRREAMLIATERHRGALLAAVCSLAGVGMGFGLSQMAATNNNCQHAVTVEHVRSHAPLQATVTPHTFAAPQIAKYTWLGVEGHTMRGEDSADSIGIGAVVTRVFPGSPAAAAGLQPGSLITSVEGTPVVSFPGLIAAIRSHDKGDQVTVDFVNSDRAGRAAYPSPSQPYYRSTNHVEVTLGDIATTQFHELEGTRIRGLGGLGWERR